MTKQNTILLLKSQDERTVQTVYNQYQSKFENWLKGRYKIIEEADRKEIYQRSFTVLFFNVKRGKLDDLSASIETYLFGVGKMILKEWWRERGEKGVILEETLKLEKIELYTSIFEEEDTIDGDLKLKMAKALNQMGEPCRTILKLFYWERNSMEAIANKTGYKNEQGAKKKKYLCLTKLRELMQQ